MKRTKLKSQTNIKVRTRGKCKKIWQKKKTYQIIGNIELKEGIMHCRWQLPYYSNIEYSQLGGRTLMMRTKH